jgi:hypothetical protein
MKPDSRLTTARTAPIGQSDRPDPIQDHLVAKSLYYSGRFDPGTHEFRGPIAKSY